MVLLCKNKERRKKQEQRKRSRERRKGAGLSGAAKEDKGGRLCGARVMLGKKRSHPLFQLLAFTLSTLL